MSDEVLGPGPHTRVRRVPTKASYDRATIEAIIDEARLCHVAGVVNGRAMALATLHVREGRALYLHGSQSNALLKAVLASGEACVTMTLYDGLRLARSGFESSIAYRSVVLFGPVTEVDDDAEKHRVLDLFVDAVLAGRASEVRPMTDQEVKLTMVVRVQIEEASAKISRGPTEDFEQDLGLPIWSGTIPAHLHFDPAVPSGDGAMAAGVIALPASVQRLYDQQR
jgi:nitroimidazol reductase NimA-like FMN-containing flavoprotein (pyridoxamine 5'-phosphate oxidase superfamily)